MDPVNIPAKFEVCSFIRSCDNRGTQKNWAVPVYAHAPFSPKFLIGFCSHGPVQLVSKISNLCGPDPPTSQADGQTDRQPDR